MILARNVTYRVGDRYLLRNVSACFPAGELSLIIGPNGAGKSTFIRALCNQIRCEGGRIEYAGRDASSYSERDMAKVRAVLSQNVDIAFPLRVREVVLMGRYPHVAGKATTHDLDACDNAMDFFDVCGLAERDFLTLSGGERQRVHFARVMAQIWYPPREGPRYLFLDEPLTFLDIKYQFDFMRKVRELVESQDIVVVGVVHDLNLASHFADRLVLLGDGAVLAHGTAEEVLRPKLIGEAFGIEPVLHRSEDRLYLFFN